MSNEELSSLVFMVTTPNAGVKTIKISFSRLKSAEAIEVAKKIILKNPRWKKILMES